MRESCSGSRKWRTSSAGWSGLGIEVFSDEEPPEFEKVE